MQSELLKKLAVITEEERRILQYKSINKREYTSQSDFKIERELMLKKGQTIRIRPHTRFAPFPMHSHDFVEMMYMCSGSTTHCINGQETLELKKGELLILNRNAKHSIEQAGEDDIAVNFIVLPAFFDLSFQLIGEDNILGQFLLSILKTNSTSVRYMHFHVSEILPIQNLIENLIWSLIYNQANNRHINQNTMALLFLQLLNYTEYMTLSQSSGHSDGVMMSVLKEIEENYPHASLTDLAEKHRMSAAYLSDMVHRATGQTFKKLLQNKRLDKAVLLLTKSKLPIEDIAAAVGYSNTSYFYRIFRTAYGTSPGEYRIKLKSNHN